MIKSSFRFARLAFAAGWGWRCKKGGHRSRRLWPQEQHHYSLIRSFARSPDIFECNYGSVSSAVARVLVDIFTERRTTPSSAIFPTGSFRLLNPSHALALRYVPSLRVSNASVVSGLFVRRAGGLLVPFPELYTIIISPPPLSFSLLVDQPLENKNKVADLHA